MEIERKTVTVEQAATFLGIGRNTAYQQVRAGIIPCLRFGKRIVVPKAALEKLLLLAEAGQDREPGATS